MNAVFSRLTNWLKGRSFSKNVALLASGTALGHVLIAGTMPILSRLYDPAAFGIRGMYVSVLTMLAVLGTFRLASAIPVAKDEETATSLLHLCGLIVVVEVVLCTIVLGLLGSHIAAWARRPEIEWLAWAWPLGLLAMGTFETINCWASRRKAFAAIARSKLSHSASMVTTQTTLGFFPVGPMGLIAGELVGRFTASLMLARQLLKSGSHNLWHVSRKGIWKAFLRYRRFSVVTSSSTMLQVAIQHAPVLLFIAYYEDERIAGWFGPAEGECQQPRSFRTKHSRAGIQQQ